MSTIRTQFVGPLTGNTTPTTPVAFSAYAGTGTSLTSGVNTKISYDTKQFDTYNNYSTANSRFTPTVAGYYWVTGSWGMTFASSGYSQTIIYKNGATQLFTSPIGSGSSYLNFNSASGIVYMNGTTDYLEVWGVQTTVSTVTSTASSIFVFQAYLIGAA